MITQRHCERKKPKGKFLAWKSALTELFDKSIFHLHRFCLLCIYSWNWFFITAHLNLIHFLLVPYSINQRDGKKNFMNYVSGLLELVLKLLVFKSKICDLMSEIGRVEALLVLRWTLNDVNNFQEISRKRKSEHAIVKKKMQKKKFIKKHSNIFFWKTRTLQFTFSPNFALKNNAYIIQVYFQLHLKFRKILKFFSGTFERICSHDSRQVLCKNSWDVSENTSVIVQTLQSTSHVAFWQPHVPWVPW